MLHTPCSNLSLYLTAVRPAYNSFKHQQKALMFAGTIFILTVAVIYAISFQIPRKRPDGCLGHIIPVAKFYIWTLAQKLQLLKIGVPKRLLPPHVYSLVHQAPDPFHTTCQTFMASNLYSIPLWQIRGEEDTNMTTEVMCPGGLY
jgi:hypothetical protein